MYGFVMCCRSRVAYQILALSGTSVKILIFSFIPGDGQVDFDEFMTILGPKLVSSEGRDGFLGNTIDSIFWQVSGNSFKCNFSQLSVASRSDLLGSTKCFVRANACVKGIQVPLAVC